MYDFTEDGSNSSAAVFAYAWDDEGFGGDSSGLRSAEEHKLESERTWGLMNDQFTNAGYREGITAGKEGALQGGFDAGFADVGAPLGREIGNLRGIVAALSHLLKSPASSRGVVKLRWPIVEGMGTEERTRLAEEVGGLAKRLNALGLHDLAPPDEEALAHAREHASSILDEASDAIKEKETLSTSDMKNPKLIAVDEEAEGIRQKHAKGVLELADIKNSLAVILQKLGLEDILSRDTREDDSKQLSRRL